MSISKTKALEALDRKISEFQVLIKAATYENRYNPAYNKVYYGAEDLIATLFSQEDRLAFRRNVSGIAFAVVGGYVDMAREVRDYQDHLQKCIGQLEVYKEKVELTWESSDLLSTPKNDSVTGSDVFIVYGHDDSARFQVAHHIGVNLKLNPIMLDQNNSASSLTIVEDVERRSASAGYAVAILTPDDIGGLQEDGEQMQGRARQNVILELGYFWGKLGRDKLCILKKGKLEIPSDLAGIKWVDMDDGSWREQLREKLKGAGILN